MITAGMPEEMGDDDGGGTRFAHCTIMAILVSIIANLCLASANRMRGRWQVLYSMRRSEVYCNECLGIER